MSDNYDDIISNASAEEVSALEASLARRKAQELAAADKEQEAFGRNISRMTTAEYQNWMRQNGYSGTGS